MARLLRFAAVLLWCVLSVNAKNLQESGFSERGCEGVRQFFHYKNVSVPVVKDKGSVCGGECCGDETEDLLRKQGQKDFATLLRHNSRTLQGLLSFTAASQQTYVSDLSYHSENKTLQLFSQVYKGMAILSREPISHLYNAIRNYILINSTKTESNSIDIRDTVGHFFDNFFPLVYHNILHIKHDLDFTQDYKVCLRKTTDTIQPFGEIPKQIAQSLAKSLDAMRMLLQAFAIGTEVLSTTDRLLVDETTKGNSECHQALLKMHHCPKCLDVKHTKPCTGYCLNVLRGCLARYVAELDSPWNGYVEGVESLINVMKKNKEDAGGSADNAIRSLDSKISETIMRAMQNSKDIDMKVQRLCGKPTFANRTETLLQETSTTLPSTAKPRTTSQRGGYGTATENHSNLNHFQTSISKTKGFYANLADTLCKDSSFAEPKDQHCWNGDRIAEYNQVVVDVGLDMQKYNPEVKPATNLQSVDPRVADLVDKLRHVHHMAMSSLGPGGASAPVDVDYMQRDGFEGSGSGNGPDDERDDEYNPTGSGSGNGPITDEEPRVLKPTHTQGEDKHPSRAPTHTAGASSSFALTALLWCPLALALALH